MSSPKYWRAAGRSCVACGKLLNEKLEIGSYKGVETRRVAVYVSDVTSCKIIVISK